MDSCMSPEEEATYRRSFRTGIPGSRTRSSSVPRQNRRSVAQEKLNRSYEPQKSPKNNNVSFSRSPTSQKLYKCKVYTLDGAELNTTFTIVQNKTDLNNTYIISSPNHNIFPSCPQSDLNTTFSIPKGDLNTTFTIPQGQYHPDVQSRNCSPPRRQPNQLSPQPGSSGICRPRTTSAPSSSIWAVPEGCAPKVKPPNQGIIRAKSRAVRPSVQSRSRRPIPINERPPWVDVQSCEESEFPTKSQSFFVSPFPRKSVTLPRKPNSSPRKPQSALSYPIRSPKKPIYSPKKSTSLPKESTEILPSNEVAYRRACQGSVTIRRKHPSSPPRAVPFSENTNRYPGTYQHCQEYVRSFNNTRGVTDDITANYIKGASTDLGFESLEPQFTDKTKPPFPEWYTPGVRWNFKKEVYEPIYQVKTERGAHISARFKHLQVAGRVNDPGVSSEAERQLEEQLFHGFRHLYAPYPNPEEKARKMTTQPRKSWKKCEASEYASQDLPCQPRKRWPQKGSSPEYATQKESPKSLLHYVQTANVKRCPPPVFERAPLEHQYHDRSKPPVPEWETTNVRWNPETGGYQPIYEVETERGPHISSRFKHLQVAGRVNDPVSTSDAERQLEEQLFHGFRYLYAPYPVTQSSPQATVIPPTQQHCTRGVWSKPSEEPQFAVKTPSPPRRRKWCKPSAEEKPSFEVPSWVRSAQIQEDMPSGALPSWAEDKTPCLDDEEEEPEDELGCYEYKAIPSWAKQVTINRMDVNEKEVKKPKKRLSGQQRIHPGALSYLTNLPQWIRKQSGEKEYLERLPSWIHKAHSSEDVKNEQCLGGIGHEVYITEIEQVWPPISCYLPSDKRNIESGKCKQDSPVAATSRGVTQRSKLPCSKYKLYQLLKRYEQERLLDNITVGIPKRNTKRRDPDKAWEDSLGCNYSFLDNNKSQKDLPSGTSNINFASHNINVMNMSSSQYPQAKNTFTTTENGQCSSLPSRPGAIQHQQSGYSTTFPSGNQAQSATKKTPQCRSQDPQLSRYSSIPRPSNVPQRSTMKVFKLPMALSSTIKAPQHSISQLSKPSLCSARPSTPYGITLCSSQGKSKPQFCSSTEKMSNLEQGSNFQTSKKLKETDISSMITQRSISKKVCKPPEDSLLQKSLKAEILHGIIQGSKLPMKPSTSDMISQGLKTEKCSLQSGTSRQIPQSSSSSIKTRLPNQSQPLQLSFQFSKLSLRGSCEQFSRNLDAHKEEYQIEEIPKEVGSSEPSPKKKKRIKSDKPHAALIKKLNCNAKQLLNNLIKSPIQVYDKIMSFITNINAAVDEEDISRIEATDHDDECETANIFQLKDGDNFLIFIKEKHLLQGISYSKIAADLIVAQHIKKIRQQDSMRSDCGEEALNNKQASNMVQTQIVQEFNESNNMIEVVGYIGCTGVTDDVQNITERKAKECVKNNEEDEVPKEPSIPPAEEVEDEIQNDFDENQVENDE